MRASTTQPSNTTHEAQFLAPEPDLSAGVEKLSFRSILDEALTEPGMLSAAYRAFHNYSVGNQMLAAMQLAMKGLPLAPIASFNAWRTKGRTVRKGQRAISLSMPVPVKRSSKGEGRETSDAGGEDKASTFNVFMLRPNWFSLDQTEGEDFTPELKAPSWDAAAALACLDVAEVPFELLRGNVLGYAAGRTIAISPLNTLKHKTCFHELAHVVLGHTTDGAVVDGEELTRNIIEVEAESVAYILCTLLDLPGQAESRGYIQSWLSGEALPERSAQRIFSAADKIMKAGQPTTQEGGRHD